jgi:hypothetical protein
VERYLGNVETTKRTIRHGLPGHALQLSTVTNNNYSVLSTFYPQVIKLDPSSIIKGLSLREEAHLSSVKYVVFVDSEDATGPKVHSDFCAYYWKWLLSPTRTTSWVGPFDSKERAWEVCQAYARKSKYPPSEHFCFEDSLSKLIRQVIGDRVNSERDAQLAFSNFIKVLNELQRSHKISGEDYRMHKKSYESYPEKRQALLKELETLLNNK